MDQEYVAQLNAALEATLAPDTQSVKQATRNLNEQFYKSPKCVPALFQILQTSQNTTIQQLAAIELRKRIGSGKAKFWKKTAIAMRSQIKCGLLDKLASGNAIPPSVSHAASQLVAAIAKVEICDKQWPELFGWLWGSASNADPAAREIGIYTLYCILDSVVSEELLSHLGQLLQLFTKTLNDPDNLGIRIITLRALGKVAEYMTLDENADVGAYQALVPNMVAVLGQALEAGDTDGIKHGFDVLETLLSIDMPIISPHLADLVKFQLQVAGNKHYSEDARVMALNSLLWLIKLKKNKVQSLNLPHTIIEGLLPIGAEDESDDPHEDDGDTPTSVAFQCLDTLSKSLPPSHVFPPLFQLFQQCCGSSDPKLRKSAILAFGVTLEGVALYIQPHLSQLWPYLEQGLKDPEVIVRNAACKALVMCITEVLDDEGAARHETLLPILSDLINHEATQRYAMVALEAYLETMGDTIVPYLPTLMDRLVGLLDNTPDKLKSIAVGVIGSTAHAAGDKFAPYFEMAMQRITPFLGLIPEDGETSEQGSKPDLRGVSQDTVGTLAEAVGKEAYRPYYQPTMELAFKAIGLKNQRLKECSFLYFGTMAKVFGEESAPLLPTVMPLLITSLEQSEVSETDEESSPATKTDEFTSTPEGPDDKDEDDEDFEDMEDVDDVDLDASAVSAVVVEKQVASDTLLEIFRYMKQHFLPYIEQTTKALLPLLEHFWDGNRNSAATTLLSYVFTFHELSGAEEWIPGFHPKPLQSNLKQLVDAVLPPIIEMWANEVDVDVVNSLLANFQGLLEKVGPALVVPTLFDTVCHLVLQILEKKAPCQLIADEDEEASPTEQPIEQSESDTLLTGAACDLVAALAKALGADFGQAFGRFFPEIARYCDTSRTAIERSAAVGALAEVAEAMGADVDPFLSRMLHIALIALADEEFHVNTNGAFLVGTLVTSTSQDLSSQYGQFLSGLQRLFIIDEGKKGDSLRARDNACGTVARMVLRNASAVPLESVLPPLIGYLPLDQDFEPYPNLIEMFFQLFQSQNPVLAGKLDQLLHAFGQVLQTQTSAETESAGPLTASTHARLLELLKALPQKRVKAAGLQQYM